MGHTHPEGSQSGYVEHTPSVDTARVERAPDKNTERRENGDDPATLEAVRAKGDKLRQAGLDTYLAEIRGYEVWYAAQRPPLDPCGVDEAQVLEHLWHVIVGSINHAPAELEKALGRVTEAIVYLHAAAGVPSPVVTSACRDFARGAANMATEGSLVRFVLFHERTVVPHSQGGMDRSGVAR